MNTRIYGQEIPSRITLPLEERKTAVQKIINNIFWLNKNYLLSIFNGNDFSFGGRINYNALFKREKYGYSIEINNIFIAYASQTEFLKLFPGGNFWAPISIDLIFDNKSRKDYKFIVNSISASSIETYKYKKDGRKFTAKIINRKIGPDYSPENYYKTVKKSLKLNDSRFFDSQLIKKCLAEIQKSDSKPNYFTKMLESDLREDAKHFSTCKQNDNNIENFLESGFYSENLSIIAREIIEYNAKTARSSPDFQPFLSPLKKMWDWVTQ